MTDRFQPIDRADILFEVSVVAGSVSIVATAEDGTQVTATADTVLPHDADPEDWAKEHHEDWAKEHHEDLFDEAYEKLQEALADIARTVDPKACALANHLGYPVGCIEDEGGDEYTCTEERGTWKVLTDDEADEAFKDQIDSLIDEQVFDEIPEQYHKYFDRDRYIQDQLQAAQSEGGRGPTIASYDGDENEEKIDGEWYFIYRIN